MESGFIIHKLITSFPNDAVEREASDDSLFWSHFSEGSLMMQLQMGISVAITTGAVAHGQMPGVEMSEDGRKGVGQYGKILMVSGVAGQNVIWDGLLMWSARAQWLCPMSTTTSSRSVLSRKTCHARLELMGLGRHLFGLERVLLG